jgi:hypothetical protein
MPKEAATSAQPPQKGLCNSAGPTPNPAFPKKKKSSQPDRWTFGFLPKAPAATRRREARRKRPESATSSFSSATSPPLRDAPAPTGRPDQPKHAVPPSPQRNTKPPKLAEKKPEGGPTRWRRGICSASARGRSHRRRRSGGAGWWRPQRPAAALALEASRRRSQHTSRRTPTCTRRWCLLLLPRRHSRSRLPRRRPLRRLQFPLPVRLSPQFCVRSTSHRM